MVSTAQLTSAPWARPWLIRCGIAPTTRLGLAVSRSAGIAPSASAFLVGLRSEGMWIAISCMPCTSEGVLMCRKETMYG